MVNRVASSNASLSLKVVGIVCILSFFVDFMILLLGFSPTDKQLQIGFATALVDRGIVPLVGLGMISAAYWFDNAENRSGIDLRFPSLILSSVLGLMFLLIFPLHLNNVRQASTQRVNQISQDAQQAETQLNSQLSQFQDQLANDRAKAQLEQVRNQAKTQFTELIKDENRYKQALENPQLPAEQKELLKKFKANPQELDKFIAQQTDPNQVAQQRISQIRQRKEEAEKQAKDNAWKSGLRIGISSLLLSIGYIIIGWTGLKGMGVVQGGKRKAPAR
ncbi:HpsJ family protein [Anabaena sp. UHCC 0451]|uniref:hormogonium polysaccharide biosynthesis protein HpsJ n=1 Tax=Anabaena sp. UHCC 0451 TaxID=2055235 RepID=UPI002B207043|nr:HpsJ family protein [Anabaena sp. UHCC 0451]MEA5575415.1 HpsJ family protein [Anabaena sp. UHCC 0451]